MADLNELLPASGAAPYAVMVGATEPYDWDLGAARASSAVAGGLLGAGETISGTPTVALLDAAKSASGAIAGATSGVGVSGDVVSGTVSWGTAGITYDREYHLRIDYVVGTQTRSCYVRYKTNRVRTATA